MGREKEIKAITLDPNWETADVDVNNTSWPAHPFESRFEIYNKNKKGMMRDYNEQLKPLNDEQEHKEEVK